MTEERRERIMEALHHAMGVLEVLERTNENGEHDKRIAGIIEMLRKLDNLWSC